MEADRDGEPAAVVSEVFGSRFHHEQNVVGRALETRGGASLSIVGVARDTKVRNLGEAPRPYVYQAQRRSDFFTTRVVVRGRGTNAELLAAARSVLAELDPDMVVMEARTMNDHLALMLFPPRMAALLLSLFGALALTLSAVGISIHAVTRRTRELGIRMSLGASAADVVAMAVGGGTRLVFLGGGLGVAPAGGVTWALKSFRVLPL